MLPQLRRAVLVLLLVKVVVGQPWVCSNGVHTWVRHTTSTTTPCPGNSGFGWNNIGFNYQGANPGDQTYQSPGCQLNGIMEASQDTCALWSTIPVTLTQSCAAVGTLVSTAGWGCATYNLNKGWFLTCASGWGDQYTPKANNICWGFTCSYQYFLGIYTTAAGSTATTAASNRSRELPSSWSCSAAKYGTGDGCDCQCGDWDPDCDDYSAQMNDCGARHVCVPFECASRPVVLGQRKEGMRLLYGDPVFSTAWNAQRIGNYRLQGEAEGKSIPPAWHCPADYFGADDGCDCGCGAWDPDCDAVDEPVVNCRTSFGDRRAYRCLAENATCAEVVA